MAVCDCCGPISQNRDHSAYANSAFVGESNDHTFAMPMYVYKWYSIGYVLWISQGIDDEDEKKSE